MFGASPIGYFTMFGIASRRDCLLPRQAESAAMAGALKADHPFLGFSHTISCTLFSRYDDVLKPSPSFVRGGHAAPTSRQKPFPRSSFG